MHPLQGSDRRIRLSGGDSLAAIARKLHIGCFDVVHDGWLNTDVTLHMALARIPGLPRVLRAAGLIPDERWAAYESGAFRRVFFLDLTRPLPFRDGSLDAVLASHVLEHLTRTEAAACVREAHRILRPGGVLRVAVPDLDAVVSAYDREDPDSFLDGLLQGRERSTSRHRHWWSYNEVSLRALLGEAGFVETPRREFGEGECPDVERIDTRPGSLFMEGIR